MQASTTLAVVTCGSFNEFNGIDTVVEVFERTNSTGEGNGHSNMGLFSLSPSPSLVMIASNDDDTEDYCSLIGKTGSLFDSALVAWLVEGREYLIHVVRERMSRRVAHLSSNSIRITLCCFFRVLLTTRMAKSTLPFNSL